VELRQLRYAVAVADYLNFRQASRALGGLRTAPCTRHVPRPGVSIVFALSIKTKNDKFTRNQSGETF
jgi:hypothetical protein